MILPDAGEGFRRGKIPHPHPVGNWHNLFGSTYREADMCSYSLPISKREHFSKDMYQRGDQGYMHMVIQSSMMYDSEKLVKSKR